MWTVVPADTVTQGFYFSSHLISLNSVCCCSFVYVNVFFQPRKHVEMTKLADFMKYCGFKYGGDFLQWAFNHYTYTVTTQLCASKEFESSNNCLNNFLGSKTDCTSIWDHVCVLSVGYPHRVRSSFHWSSRCPLRLPVFLVSLVSPSAVTSTKELSRE